MCCNDGSNFDGGGGGGSFALPEQWAQNDVAANQAAVVMSAQVSTNFDDLKMPNAGILLALTTRFTEPITAGTCTIIITINGAPTTLQVVHTNAANQSGGIALGGVAYAAGDLIGMTITTDAGFLPITTDVEAWIMAQEA